MAIQEIYTEKRITWAIWDELKAAGVPLEGISMCFEDGEVFVDDTVMTSYANEIHAVLDAHNPDRKQVWETEYLKVIKDASYSYITKAYPEWKQANILRDFVGNPESETVRTVFNTMSQFIDEARFISNEYERRIKAAADKAEMDAIMAEAQELYGHEV